jgi:hypothetical protein
VGNLASPFKIRDEITEMDREFEQEEDLAELEGDGPGDLNRLNIYSNTQHFTNIQSLDQSSKSPKTVSARRNQKK